MGDEPQFAPPLPSCHGARPRFIEAGIAATCALVVVVCLLGILADLLSCCCPLSYMLFNLASLLGVIVCLFLAVLVALELSMSVAISDFCYNGVDASFHNILDEIDRPLKKKILVGIWFPFAQFERPFQPTEKNTISRRSNASSSDHDVTPSTEPKVDRCD